MKIIKNRATACIVALLLLIPVVGFAEGDALNAIHEKIVSDYPQVKHINAGQLTKMKPDNIVLFDVREKKEYAVSHIVDAIQIDPKISLEEFDNRYAETLNGKTVVFYCSVGRRSSKLAIKLNTVIVASGAMASYNLEGGAFRWHNEQRPLMSVTDAELNQVTDKIHPYNLYWSRLIEDKKTIEYSPTKLSN